MTTSFDSSFESSPQRPKRINLRKSLEEFSDAVSVSLEDENDITEKSLHLAQFLERMARQLRNKVQRYDGKYVNNVGKKSQKRKIPPRVAENIFIITFILQIVCVGSLQLVDTLASKYALKETEWYITGIVVSIAFQAVNLALAIVVTVKLTKQYMHHTATTRFLLQSYLSTLFIFGGIYTFIGRVWPHTFDGLKGRKSQSLHSLIIYSELLFTSISTGTLCGAASVVAIHWSTELLMSFQMIMSFVYFASILSQVINPPFTSKPSDKKSNERSRLTSTPGRRHTFNKYSNLKESV